MDDDSPLPLLLSALERNLRWPPDVLAQALLHGMADFVRLGDRAPFRWDDYFARLLRSAFRRPDMAQEFLALGWDEDAAWSMEPPSWSPDQMDWIARLAAELKQADYRPTPTPVVRSKRNQPPTQLTEPEFIAAALERIGSLHVADGLWAESLGVGCENGCGTSIHAANQTIARRFGWKDPEQVWPVTKHDQWDLEPFLDFIEILWHEASWPALETDGCGRCVEYSKYSSAIGRGLFTDAINDLLADSGLMLRLSNKGPDAGTLVRTSETEGLDELVTDILGTSFGHVADDNEIAHAIATFRDRHRTVPAMRGALATLYKHLDTHRSHLKVMLLPEDEDALFHIANRFDIRHGDTQKQPQKYGVENPAWLEWIFHFYLASICLLGKLLDDPRQHEQASKPDEGLRDAEPGREEPF